MAIAITVKEYLLSQDVKYQPVSPLLANNNSPSHEEPLAKAVMLENEFGISLMATIPADQQLSLSAINTLTDCHYQPMEEKHAQHFFTGCKSGAIPSVGDAFGIEMIVDDALLASHHIYIEAGDHKTLLQIDHDDYAQLVQCSRHAHITGENTGASHYN